jgi:hypothetical protein
LAGNFKFKNLKLIFEAVDYTIPENTFSEAVALPQLSLKKHF